MKQIPKDWTPCSKVYQKAESAGMKPEWIKKQLKVFIEVTMDKGQSLNQHFMNWLRKKHAANKKKSPLAPSSKIWRPKKIHKTDRKDADRFLKTIRESL